VSSVKKGVFPIVAKQELAGNPLFPEMESGKNKRAARQFALHSVTSPKQHKVSSVGKHQGGYKIIFSMGMTKMPSAPSAFSLLMISQK
jgi:hypothetical protein